MLTSFNLPGTEEGGTEFNDAADEIMHLAWILNPDDFETDPLAE